MATDNREDEVRGIADDEFEDVEEGDEEDLEDEDEFANEEITGEVGDEGGSSGDRVKERDRGGARRGSEGTETSE